ncbi:hypothetical protein U9M48_030620 [Paspalum notatum var. saurae]|uniref:C2 domain-containing protein n=1 Tax=Paspalum notatum var. saurae TaxID=547442 RepID=A0AAQ3U192_PASNO
MAYRELELTLLSAQDLKNVNLITRMDVYAVVTISGNPLTRQCTAPDPYGGRHPCWNATLRFAVPPTPAAAAGACLHVLLRAERVLGDRDVGEVVVPLADLLAAAPSTASGPQPPQLASYQVRKVHRWEPRGVLNVAYRLGPVVAPVEPPVMAYPVSVPQQQPSHPAAQAYPPPAPRPAANHAAEHGAARSPPTEEKSNGRGPAGPSQVCVGPHTQIILGAPTGPGTMVSPTGSIVSPAKPKQQDTQVVRAAHATPESMSTVGPTKEDRSMPKMSSQNSIESGFGRGNGNLSTHQHGSSTHSLSPPSSPYPSYPSTSSPFSSAHSSTHSPYSAAHTSIPSPWPLGQRATSDSFGARGTSHADSPRSISTRGVAATSPFPSSLVVAK